MDNEPTHENPRTARVRAVILDAAVELLIEHGAERVTASHIATETRVARTTIYRHWPDQASLLLATIEKLVTPHGPPTISGDVEEDLNIALSSLRVRLTTRKVRPIFAALVAHSARDDDFIAAQRTFINGLVEPTASIIDAAKDDGQLQPDLDSLASAHDVAGPLLHRFLALHEVASDEDTVRTVHDWVTANRRNP